MSIDNRAVSAIKIVMNRMFGNKSSENRCIATIIAGFSHYSMLKKGDAFQSFHCDIGSCFYIVGKLYSPFWAQVYWMPSIRSVISTIPISFSDRRYQRIVYYPDYRNASPAHKKRIFSPFSDKPYIKQRGRNYNFHISGQPHPLLYE